MCEALILNTSLKKLNIFDNEMRHDVEPLCKMIGDNENIQSLDISYNNIEAKSNLSQNYSLYDHNELGSNIRIEHREAICRMLANNNIIYTSTTEKEAELALENFDKKWGKQYPHIAKSWYNNWENLIIFLQYPNRIRKIIYTTNAIESLNSQLRKVTRNKRVFPNDDAVFKVLYLTIDYITKKNGPCLFQIGMKLWLIL